MKISSRRLLGLVLLGLVFASAGCGTAIPALVRDGYRKSTVDSTALRVGRFWVERIPGRSVVVTGSVTRRPGDADTGRSRLVIIVRDAVGVELLREKSDFQPQKLPEGWGPHYPGALFRHEIANFPANAAEIIVMAVD